MFLSSEKGKKSLVVSGVRLAVLAAALLLVVHGTLLSEPAESLLQGEDSAPQALPATQPDSPLQIISTHPVHPDLSPRISERLSRRSVLPREYRATLKATSPQDVVAYALRWVWLDASGGAAGRRGACSSRFSFLPEKPAIRGGGVGETSAKLVQKGPSLKVLVDFVLLADGSMYGDNECGALQTFQDNLTSRLSTEKWILSVLESQGADEAKRLLHSDLANESWYQTLLHPKQVPQPGAQPNP